MEGEVEYQRGGARMAVPVFGGWEERDSLNYSMVFARARHSRNDPKLQIVENNIRSDEHTVQFTLPPPPPKGCANSIKKKPKVFRYFSCWGATNIVANVKKQKVNEEPKGRKRIKWGATIAANVKKQKVNEEPKGRKRIKCLNIRR